MGLTLVEKIAACHADGLPAGTVVRAGDFVSIRPRHVMTHDNTGAVIPKFKQIGATRVADPAQPVFAIDHDIQNVTPKNLEKYAKIEAFAGEHGIPGEVMHIIATHSHEGDKMERSIESIIFHHADFVDFDIAKFLGKRAAKK